MGRTVLVLGARAPAALDHARRFHAQGWRVIVADSAPCRLSAWSRSVHASRSLPGARASLLAYSAALEAIVADWHVDLIVPTCEEVFYLAAIAPALPASVRVACADLDTLRRLHSKWAFLQVAAASGVAVPDSARVTSMVAARAWAAGRAVVLKPEFSRFGSAVRMYPAGIPGDAAPLPALGDWVVQQLEQGRELCSYSIADRGRLRAHVTYRPAYRLPASASFWFGSIDAPGVEAAVAAIVMETEFTGQIAFDWIERSNDGSVVPIECNPRAVSGLHLFGSDAGLPAALAGSAEAGSADACVRVPAGTSAMLGPVMLAAGWRRPNRPGPLADWWHDLKAAREVLAVPTDPLPLLGAVVDLAAFAGIARRTGTSVREATTVDTEWNGEAMVHG